MKRVEWLTRLVLLGCVLYAGAILARPHGEYFPVFSWSLFSKVPPAVQQDYALRFTEINGLPLDPPAYFTTLRTQIKSASSPGAYSLGRQLGGDLDRKSPRAVQSRTLFEAAYLGDLSSARYEVVRRKFDQLDRLACEEAGREASSCFLEEEVVGEFELGKFDN